MKKLSVLLIMLLGVSAPLVSQTSGSADVDVNVFVVSAMVVSGERNLELGTVLQGESKEVLSNNFGEPGAAQFHITATSGIEINITLTPPSQLIGPGDPIPFTASDPYRSDNADGTGNTEELVGWSASSGGSLQTNGTEVYLWFGGSVTTDANQIVGSYTGIYIVEAAYIGL